MHSSINKGLNLLTSIKLILKVLLIILLSEVNSLLISKRIGTLKILPKSPIIALNCYNENKSTFNFLMKKASINLTVFTPVLFFTDPFINTLGDRSLIWNLSLGFFIYLGAILRTNINSDELINSVQVPSIKLYKNEFLIEFVYTTLSLFLSFPDQIFESLIFNLLYFIFAFYSDIEYPGAGLTISFCIIPMSFLSLASRIFQSGIFIYLTFFIPLIFYSNFLELGDGTLIYGSFATIIGSIYRILTKSNLSNNLNDDKDFNSKSSNFINFNTKQFFNQNVVIEILYLTLLSTIIY